MSISDFVCTSASSAALHTAASLSGFSGAPVAVSLLSLSVLSLAALGPVIIMRTHLNTCTLNRHCSLMKQEVFHYNAPGLLSLVVLSLWQPSSLYPAAHVCVAL